MLDGVIAEKEMGEFSPSSSLGDREEKTTIDTLCKIPSGETQELET